jgi:hypothetical protein
MNVKQKKTRRVLRQKRKLFLKVPIKANSMHSIMRKRSTK